MSNSIKLIVMLTSQDKTVDNAYSLFEQCKNAKAKYWGFKEKPLPIEQMKILYSYMKECGKVTILEVVAYDEKKSMEGAKIGVECGCDILMGTKYFDSVNLFCKENNLKYMPFVGDVKGRPSLLDGTIDDIINEANQYIHKGVYGFDLLGYRYVGDSETLIKKFISEVDAPVCVAGGVNSYEKLNKLKDVTPWSITVGTGFFENKFGETVYEQINNVYDFINK